MQRIARIVGIVCVCMLLYADVYDEDMLAQEGVIDPLRAQNPLSLQGFGLDSHTPTPKELFDNISEQNTAIPLSSALLPQQYILPDPLPEWIYATAIIEVHFNDGSMRRGFASMLKNGLYITSSEIVHSASLVPRAIYAKMQDSSAAVIICTARLNLKAVDTYSGLALLENIASTDDYCNVVQKSYYHDRIQKYSVVDVFNNAPSVNPKQEVFFPYVDKYYYFVPEMMRVGEVEEYYDQTHAKSVKYGYRLERDAYPHFAYGKGFFDTKGRFLGLISLTRHSYLPVFVKKEVVQDFLCSLDEHKVLQDKDISKKCATLRKRERFF
ncbi:hypothetical protein [uncultured Helicobacter sp.]|uniref:hypothetical protein n=1 Tax=uncultured Helicobacter sp. TaxID=175537 RepID=UPI00374FB7E8